MILVWSVLVTLILVIYFFLSLALYLEERNYARRQQQLVEAWRIANPWSPPPEVEQQRDIERGPLVHDFDDEDGEAGEEEEEEERGTRQGAGGGCTTTMRGWSIITASGGTANDPSPPHSPGPPDSSSIIPTEPLVELPDDEHEPADVATLPSPSERGRVDSSGVTANAATWAHLEPIRRDGGGDSGRGNSSSHTSEQPPGLAPSRILGDREASSSSSSSLHSPRVLDEHELVTKIKKAVHWPPGLNSGSSSSSSSSSPKTSSQPGESQEELRKRSSQE
ncbi:uncharacterized protein PG986_003590 [Apiospora aurea]|uniref:Uncharacterized protein n=1 Tax=Apiospora aurea TaxID=335848 RepID=A0ABR1QS51_9PEZI